MQLALALTLLCALFAAAYAQTYKLNGKWTRATCTCTADATALCDDLWQTEYANVMYPSQVPSGLLSTTTGWSSNQTQPNQPRQLGFYLTDPEFTLAPLPAAPALLPLTGYWCHGWMGKEITCESPDQLIQYCKVTFDCVSGDCVTTIVTIFVLSLFLLIAPNVFPGLMAMAFAAVAFSANKGEGQWEIKLAVFAGIFVFLAFAGLNALAASGSNYFDQTLAGFSGNGCFRYYGLDQKSARCAQYLLFVGFDGFLIMMLVPLLVIVLIGRLGDNDK